VRTRDDGDGGREFVDENGVRHIVLPRRWSERRDDARAGPFEDSGRARRIIVIRRSGADFADDDD
jgi:hypothetical protein